MTCLCRDHFASVGLCSTAEPVLFQTTSKVRGEQKKEHQELSYLDAR